MSAQGTPKPPVTRSGRGAGSGRAPAVGSRRLRSLVRAAEERPEDPWRSVARLSRYLRPFVREMSVAMIGVLLASAAGAASPWLTGRVVDAALSAQGNAAAVAWPSVWLLVSYVVGWLAARQQIYALGTIGQRALVTVREQILAKILDLSVAFFDRADSGDLMSRLVNDAETLNGFFGNTFRRLFGSGLAVLATLVGMLLVEWRLALATLLVLPLMFGTTRFFAFVARRAFRRTRESIGDVSSSLAEELAGIRVTQAFARTGANREEFSRRNAENRDANITAAAVSSAFSPSLDVIAAIAAAVVAAFGGYLAIGGSVTIGVVVAFFAYARQFFNGVNQLSSLYADTQSAIAGGERIFGLLDTPPEVSDAPDATDMGRAEGRIDFEGVSFGYGGGSDVLHGVDLHVEPGTTLAIVGPTGAGKSTLVNLVARFYDPTSGIVRIDGHDLRDVTTSSLRRNLGIVLQEPFLFSGTVADNIRYGRLDASADEVREAARLSRALEFVDVLPNGLDTPVGERGALLSTGQRQLIAFARAILASPAILILDEATSSVDTRTEALIQDALRTILTGRTALVIAHRLSTVRDADRIVVVDGGRIVEDGTYRELLAAGGAFARLHAAQFAGEDA
jgi:ATP-binding cassette, subfamily B, multidrug efflux pump